MKTSKNAFTLVELIVTITILAILGTIGFISLSGYAVTARDAVRNNDMQGIVSVLEHSMLQLGVYPIPDEPETILFSGSTVWNQGSFGETARRATRGLNKVPTDPLTGEKYTYSLATNKTEYELGGVTEESIARVSITNQTFAGRENFRSLIRGNYNGVGLLVAHDNGLQSILALPSIIASDVTNTDLEVLLSARRLSYHGEPCFGHTYGGNGTCGTLVNPSRAVFEAYSGSVSDLSSSKDLRAEVLKNMQNAYFGSDTLLSDAVEKLKSTSIVLSGVSDEAYLLANNTVQYALGLTLKEEKAEAIDPYSLTFKSINYNSNWALNSCPSDISVKYINPGEENDTIRSLDPDTVYVLSEGTYTMIGPINMANCSAIIGVGNVEIKSDRYLTELVAIHGKTNVIVDNISIDGINGTVAKNLVGIDITNSTSNSTIINVSVGNGGRGLSLANSNNISVLNVKTFKNSQYGYYLFDSNSIISENLISYDNNNASESNNNGSGIFINSSANNYFNNVIIYNNSNQGLVFASNSGSDYNTFNNIATFNNKNYGGIVFAGDSTAVNNLLSYNNAGGGQFEFRTNNNVIHDAVVFSSGHWNGIRISGSGNTYYGTISNTTHPSPGSITNLTASIPNGFWSAGTTPISNLTFGSTYAITPSSVGWNNSTSGRQAGVFFNGSETYTFGTDVANQVQPVKYNGTTLATFGSFDAGKKIGQW